MIRDAFILSLVANILLLLSAGCASIAHDSWTPMMIGLTITSITLMIGALAVLPLIWLNIRTAIGAKHDG